ncbi:MAG: hypothetical protein KGH60_01980 [Candidatus Micrarchaeota archaeon]|nr:hypothetical protein [Candidatus Micrarchaeota archaeon]
MMLHNKAQASIDFMVAYGIALLVIAIALSVVVQLGLFNVRLAPTTCNPAPGFQCTAATMNTMGVLTIAFSQATGGTLTINGAGCSSAANATRDYPAYGNVNLLPYTKAPQYYPAIVPFNTPFNSPPANSISLSSSGSGLITVYCYTHFGKATSQLGNSFSGILWLNYTISDLPSNLNNVQEMASFTAKYT